LVEGYVEHYNNVRLNSATGYIAPKWKPPDGSARVAASKRREKQATRRHHVG
jgi:hypothetical protein